MLTNQQFLEIVQHSFNSFVEIGTSRSTAKLKPLHGAIARDILTALGSGYYVQSQGIGNDKEGIIQGRYVNKNVDITIYSRKSGKAVGGIAVKFVMQNYSQNSNNYFENMLGETANIRSAHCPYFQVFIILDKLPYYKKGGELQKWEEFTNHNIEKYCKLSYDDINTFFHTPDKTLIFIVHVSPENNNIRDQKEYMEFYKTNTPELSLSKHQYPMIKEEGSVILNDYPTFMQKVYHTIMAI